MIDVTTGCNYSVSFVSFPSANLSLHELHCLYFKLKDKVFSKLGPIPHSDTETLEEILKSTFGEYRKLGSRTYPKYALM